MHNNIKIGQRFKSSDGFVLSWDGSNWTDGDLMFSSNPDGFPVESDGSLIDGFFMPDTDEAYR